MNLTLVMKYVAGVLLDYSIYITVILSQDEYCYSEKMEIQYCDEIYNYMKEKRKTTFILVPD